MRYRKYTIVVESPFQTPKEEDLAELSQNIADNYLDSFCAIESYLGRGELENTNPVISYDLLVAIDDNYTNPDTFESEWGNMVENIKKCFLSFLGKTGESYRISAEGSYDLNNPELTEENNQ